MTGEFVRAGVAWVVAKVQDFSILATRMFRYESQPKFRKFSFGKKTHWLGEKDCAHEPWFVTSDRHCGGIVFYYWMQPTSSRLQHLRRSARLPTLFHRVAARWYRLPAGTQPSIVHARGFAIGRRCSSSWLPLLHRKRTTRFLGIQSELDWSLRTARRIRKRSNKFASIKDPKPVHLESVDAWPLLHDAFAMRHVVAGFKVPYRLRDFWR